MAQVFVASAYSRDHTKVLALAQVTENLERDTLGQLLQRHTEALTFVDELIESGSDLLSSDIAEETLDSHGLLPLNDSHIVQLEEFDDKLDPLKVVRAEFDVPSRYLRKISTGCCAQVRPLVLHRAACILRG